MVRVVSHEVPRLRYERHVSTVGRHEGAGARLLALLFVVAQRGGTIDGGAIAQPLMAPTGVIPQFGGLEIDTSSTAMQALTDAMINIDDYPYESCRRAARRRSLRSRRCDRCSPPSMVRASAARDQLDAPSRCRLERLAGAAERRRRLQHLVARDERSEAVQQCPGDEALVLARQARFTVPSGTSTVRLRTSLQTSSRSSRLLGPARSPRRAQRLRPVRAQPGR